MALIEAYSDANKVTTVPEYTYTINRGSGMLGGVWCEMEDEITQAEYSYVGMTLTAATACQAAINDPQNGITAKCRHTAGAMYQVDVSKYAVTSTQTPI